jgi:large subunit ribosomal protein L13
VNTLSYKTISAKKETIERDWYVIDAEGEIVGRLASRIAHVLRGKHKPSYTPHVDTGDHVIVINADKVRFTGMKTDQKQYLRHTGYPGGQRSMTPREAMAKKPYFVIENAVRGMLPKNSLGRQMFRKLHVHAGPDHPHVAQQPKEFNF